MSKKWTLLTLAVSLCSTGAVHAGPLDSRDIVYIDGKPCNSACQSWMNWSARAQAARYRGPYDGRVAVADVQCEQPAPGGSLRMTSKPVSSTSRSAMAAPKARAAMAGNAASPRIAATPRQAPPAAMDAPAAAVPTITVESIRAAATAAPPPAAMDAPGAAIPTITVESIRAAMAPPVTQDNLVALVLAPQDIESLADLNEKNIAISEKQSAASGRVSAALMAAGASDVRFSKAEASAIDRLTSGEVTAAVVLAPREIAALFPEVAGFRTFRLPLAQKTAGL